MPEEIAEQGRVGLQGLCPVDNAWLAPDPDQLLNVYLLIYPPRPEAGPRDLHWSLAWEVRRNTWRHVHIVWHNDPRAPRPQPRYVYWGAQTKVDGQLTLHAQRIMLQSMSLATRHKIERIALEVPVMKPDGQWNCQYWIHALLGKLVQEEVMDSATWSRVVAEASHAFHDQFTR